MLADSKYHVKINGVGLTLLEESYRKKSQQPFNPRFSTGDYGMGDLSFWQFLAQEKWVTQEQELFYDKTMYRQSAGWDIRDGRPRLAFGIENVTLSAALPNYLASYGADARIYDDFESGPGTLSPILWQMNLRGVYDSATIKPTDTPDFTPGGQPTSANQYSSVRGRSGIGEGQVSTTPCFVDAAAPGGIWTGGTGGSYYLNFAYADNAASFVNVGRWSFRKIAGESATSYIRNRFLFLGDASGAYIVEVSGNTNGTVKLIKSSLGLMAVVDNSADVVLATRALTVALTAESTIGITRDGAGGFTLDENGLALGGAVTDTTYSTPRYLAWSTGLYVDYIGLRAAPTNLSNYFDLISIAATGRWTTPGIPSKLVPFNDGLVFPYYTTPVGVPTMTVVRTGSYPSNLPQIAQVNADDAVVWSRDGNAGGGMNTFLVTVRQRNFYLWSNLGIVFTGTATGVAHLTGCLPINSTTLLLFGSLDNTAPYIEVVKFNASAITVASQVPLYMDGTTLQGYIVGGALDSSGTAYLAYNDFSATYGTLPSRVIRITAADAIAANPTISDIALVSDFSIRGITSVAGAIYLYGSRIRGSTAYPSIMKFPGTTVYESLQGIALTPISYPVKYNHGILGCWKTSDGVMFLASNDLGGFDPVLKLDASGNIREVACFQANQLTCPYPNHIAIAEWSGRIYKIDLYAATLQRTTLTRGGFTSGPANAILQLSDMGGNTPLILKSLYSVIVELSQALPSGQVLTAIVNGITVGTMTSTDGTYKEIGVPVNTPVVANTFTPKLQLLTAQGFNGYLKRAALKFIPVQLKKRAWGFGIRATNNLKLVDGKRDHRFAKSIFSQLETAWASNTPITFVDVDGASYSVIITEFDLRRPLISEKGDWHKEGFYFVELLEV